MLGAAQYLGAQLWTVPHAKVVGGWIPLAYVVGSFFIVGLAHRWKIHRVVLHYALAALPSLLKSRSGIGRGLVATVGVYSALISFWYLQSTAGDSPPGRFMVAVLPLLGVALGCQMERQSRRVTLALAIPLGIVSAASTLISLSDPLLARYPYGGQGGPIAILGRLVGIRTSSILPAFSSPTLESFAKVALAVVLTGFLAAVMYRAPAPTGRQVHPARVGGDRRGGGDTAGQRRG